MIKGTLVQSPSEFLIPAVNTINFVVISEPLMSTGDLKCCIICVFGSDLVCLIIYGMIFILNLIMMSALQLVKFTLLCRKNPEKYLKDCRKICYRNICTHKINCSKYSSSNLGLEFPDMN